MRIKEYLSGLLNEIAANPYNALDSNARKLSTYPEHKHTEKGLSSSKRPALIEILGEISGLIIVK